MKQILSAISPFKPYNLHSHTQWCDGHAPISDFAQAAVDAGFTHYAFTPHSPVPIASPCNMAAESVPEFLDEVERLRSLYDGRITLLSGMEVDYLSPRWGPANPYFSSLGLDIIIGSVHFIPTQDGELVDIDGSAERFRRNMHELFHDDIRYVVDTFYHQSQAMIAAGGFDIIGHFDKIGYNASLYSPGITAEPWYKAHVADIIDALAKTDIVAEINTKAYHQNGRFFPEPVYWTELQRRGIPTVVNSDAHRPELINAGRNEAFARLRAI